MKNKITIQFLGAAETVTGSKYYIEAFGKKFLIDCGLFQGLKELRLLNWKSLPVEASSIDFVLLTHGHLDHCGYLPRLVRDGFRGKIYGTPPTLDIAEIIMKDSAKIQEEEAEQANREGYSKHSPAMPLYDSFYADLTTQYFSKVNVDEWMVLGSKIKVRFQTNGHILGSTFIELNLDGEILVFSGDVGRKKDSWLGEPNKPKKADYLFIESTYGNRLHPKENISKRLEDIINLTIEKKGNIIIPSFAVERSQQVMLLIYHLLKAGRIPKIPMIIDSPMGSKVLDVFRNYKNWHHISQQEYRSMCEYFHVVQSFKETLSVIANRKSKLIIAGSGMLTGGRVLSYLQKLIEKKETTIVIVGYQGEGTRGRQLLDGAHEIKIYGNYYSVKAKVEHIQGLSAHADQKELLQWMSEIKPKPKKIFLVHGEKSATEAFRVKIQDQYKSLVVIPKLFDKTEIEV